MEEQQSSLFLIGFLIIIIMVIITVITDIIKLAIITIIKYLHVNFNLINNLLINDIFGRITISNFLKEIIIHNITSIIDMVNRQIKQM